MTLTHYTIKATKENYKFSSLENFKVSSKLCTWLVLVLILVWGCSCGGISVSVSVESGVKFFL